MPSYLTKRPNGREQVIVADSDIQAVTLLALPGTGHRIFRARDRVLTVTHNWTGATLATVYPITDAEAHAYRVQHLDDASWTINPSREDYVTDAYERLVNAW